MSGLRTVADWNSVIDEPTFVRFLGLLRQDLADGGWTSASVPEFFHTWARWIDDGLAGRTTADVLFTNPDMLFAPSWAVLAGQLAAVSRAAPSPGQRDAPVVDDEEADLVDVRAFAAWLRGQGDDCIGDEAETQMRRVRELYWSEGRWAHGLDLGDYLEATQACINDHYSGLRNVRFAASTWTEMANVLLTGKYYE